MAIHHAWKFVLFVSLCTALTPAGVNARSYTMTIQSVSAAGGKCVSAPNGQFAEGMHALIWDCNAFLTQNLSYDDQTQELKFGSNCVEVLGQGTAEDPVGIGTCSGAVTQRWSMVANGENYQVLGANSLCLNISNGVIANGTPLDLAPCVLNKAVELWALFQAADPTAAQPAAQAGSAKPGAPDETSNAGGNDAPGQIASASNRNGPGSDETGPDGGSGGGGSGSGGGSGAGSDPASTFPGPIAILIGMLNPPPYGRDNRPPRRPPSMDPSTSDMNHPPIGNMTPPATPSTGMTQPAAPSIGKTTQPKDPGKGMTPAAADLPSMHNLCSLSADGKLVQINITMPPPDPGAVTDTGQYCVSGGPRNGQCGTVALDTNSKTMQICGNGVCSPPTPLTSTKPPRGYGQTLFGVPDSSPSVPCPSSTSASNDPTGGLGPPMMDVVTGQPVYKPRSGGSPMASPPAPPTIMVALPVPLERAKGTPNVCRPKTSSSAPANVCHPKTSTLPGNPCAPPPNSSPLTLKNKPGDAGAAAATKPKTGPLTLKPQPSGTQMASAGPANPCNPKDSVPACESKPPYLPWGGHGSATITVSGGQPCGIGWHDTGATILDSMSPTSHPAHGSLTPKDKHVIIFTPAPGYKGQDSFTLSMREHNGGRSATLTVKVSVTIR